MPSEFFSNIRRDLESRDITMNDLTKEIRPEFIDAFPKIEPVPKDKISFESLRPNKRIRGM